MVCHIKLRLFSNIYLPEYLWVCFLTWGGVGVLGGPLLVINSAGWLLLHTFHFN